MRTRKIMNLSIMSLTLLFVGFMGAGSVAMGVSPPGVTAITGINVTDDTVEIKGDKAFIYTIYKPSDPYRVVVEIPDADIGTFRDVIRPNSSSITEITTSQVDTPKPIAKIELLLQSPSGVDSEYRDNSLILKAKKEAAVTTAAPAKAPDIGVAEVKQETMPPPEEKTTFPKATEITDISFDSSAGVVKVVIKGNGSMSPSVFTLKNRIVIDVPDVSLKTSTPTSVMAPVKGLRAGKYKDKTRLVVDVNGTKDFDVLSVKDTIIVAFKVPETAMVAAKKESVPPPSAIPPQELREAQPRGRMSAEGIKVPQERTETCDTDALAEGKYGGAKISLDFQDSDIVPIFRLLADISGCNIVVDPSVKGKLTMKLINVPWGQALDIVMKTAQPPLGKSVEGNIIRIAPLSVFQKENEDKKRMQESAVSAEPLETRVFLVNFAKVKDAEKAIKDAKVLTARGSISVDERTSSMVIKDAPSVFPQVEVLLLTIDKPTAQVMIEGRIVEMNTNDDFDLGIQWGIKLSAANTLTALGGASQLGAGAFTGNKFIVDTPAGVSGRGSGISFGMISPDRTFGLDMQLTALETAGSGKVISNPKILTVDNGKAKIMQGKSIPIRKLTTEGTISTEFKDVTIELNVTPHITPDGSVGMDIEIKKEELDPTVPSIEGVPGTDKKEAKSTVIVRNGETVVIGGMYKLNTSESDSGVPGLMKLPILGWLFKEKKTSTATSELLIFITPRIVERP